MKRTCLVICLLAALTPAATAGIIGVDLGTGAPPGTLGGYAMTAFTQTGIAGYTPLASIATPVGSSLIFVPGAFGAQTPGDWATWSHGYTGDIYYTGGPTSLIMTLTAGADAFIFYAEPNPRSVFRITATAHDGTQVIIDVNGDGGAAGYGFYGTGGSQILSILVTSDADFAVGEFSIATSVPEPSLCLLLGIAIGAVCLVTRRFMA